MADKRFAERASRAVLRLAILGLVSLFVATAGLGLTYNLSASLPAGIYQIRRLTADPVRGEVVGVCLRGTAAALARERHYVQLEGIQPWVYGVRCGRVAVIGKAVAAVPGDTVEVSLRGIYVNGSLLPNSALRTHDRLGRSLPHAGLGARVLGPGEFWIQSPHSSLSYDSRIFGPIYREQIVDRRIPLFTHE